eukprot:1719362-Ditylum_brightwellii.AAC.1
MSKVPTEMDFPSIPELFSFLSPIGVFASKARLWSNQAIGIGLVQYNCAPNDSSSLPLLVDGIK